MKQNVCTYIDLSFPFTGGNELFQCLAVFFAEFDDVLLSSYSCRYVHRGDAVILSRLKLHSRKL